MTFEDGKWMFKEVKRMISSHLILRQSFHTLNSYKKVIVVDVLGKCHSITSKIVSMITIPLKNI